VLAYSSVSQMGLITAVLGMGLASGNAGAVLGASLYAAHHILVKGALFLAVGVAQARGARRLWPVLLPAAVLALSLAGLPLTGGALAKLAVKGPLGDGIVGQLSTWSAAGSTLLMLHFLARLAATAAPPDTQGPAPARLVLPWLAAALASVATPWALFLTVGSGTFSEALAPATLWAAIWPVLAGGVLAIGLRRWGRWLPRVPEGDIVVLAEGATGAARASGDALERADVLLRQWPVAGVALLTIAITLGAAMLVWH
jgi:formate hydrogenlyase subunit 3/multisubunit Na+/H+ antiporter MnhD subunit